MSTFDIQPTPETHSALSLLAALADIARDPGKTRSHLDQIKDALGKVEDVHRKTVAAIHKENKQRHDDELRLEARHAELQKRENKLADIGRVNAQAQQSIQEAKEAQRDLDQRSREHDDREKSIVNRESALKLNEDDYEHRAKVLADRENSVAVAEREHRARMARLKELAG